MWSQKARYALRALLHLVEHGRNGPVQLGTIAERQAVPAKYLEAIMVDLRNAGIVASRRGRNGGHVLARPPEEISFLEVMRAMDGPIALVPCASENYYARCGDCHDEESCAIRAVASEVRAEAVRILAATTLASAARREIAAAPATASPDSFTPVAR